MSHRNDTFSGRRRLVLLLSVFAVLIAVLGSMLIRRHGSGEVRLTPERAEELGVAYLPDGRKEIRSTYSNILVEEQGTVRTLYFVSDSGRKAIETRMDLARPHQLLVPYTRTMFASYLFLRSPQHVLIVGLGGGSMVRFLEHHQPELKVDVVEIDPAVIEVAGDLFGTRSSATIGIFEQDGFEFLETTKTVYDVIYMDAFLKPSEDTDPNGAPLHLKTTAFLRDLQDKIRPNGLVVFNVSIEEDIEAIREAFAQTYLFKLDAPGTVAVGSTVERRSSPSELMRIARDLDGRWGFGLSFVDMVEHLYSRPSTKTP